MLESVYFFNVLIFLDVPLVPHFKFKASLREKDGGTVSGGLLQVMWSVSDICAMV